MLYKAKISERGFKHRVYKFSLYLFDEEIQLVSVPYALRAPHLWPFEFQFPHTVDASELAGTLRARLRSSTTREIQP